MFSSNRPIAARFAAVVLTVAAALVATASLIAAPSAEGGGIDGAGAQEPVLIYTYDVFPEPLETAVVEHMADAHGVEVIFERFQETGGILSQLRREGDETPADVVIGLDNTYADEILNTELFAFYRPEDLSLVDQSLLSDELPVVPFDYGHIMLNYDSEALDDPPETWEELTDERFRDSIILMDPRTASPGRNFLLFTVAYFGEDGFLDYWRRLSPNILTFTATWSEGYGLYTQGEAPIVLSYDTSPAYHIAFEETERYRNLILSDSAYAQVEYAGLVAGSDRREDAGLVIDYLVSQEFQNQVPLNQFMYPINPNASLPEAFDETARASEIINLDVGRVAENFDEWLGAWEEIMR